MFYPGKKGGGTYYQRRRNNICSLAKSVNFSRIYLHIINIKYKNHTIASLTTYFQKKKKKKKKKVSFMDSHLICPQFASYESFNWFLNPFACCCFFLLFLFCFFFLFVCFLFLSLSLPPSLSLSLSLSLFLSLLFTLSPFSLFSFSLLKNCNFFFVNGAIFRHIKYHRKYNWTIKHSLIIIRGVQRCYKMELRNWMKHIQADQTSFTSAVSYH